MRSGYAALRLDWVYLPPELVEGMKDISHHFYLSDHKYLRMVLELPEFDGKVKKKKIDHSTFWKLNCSILEENDFLHEFEMMWERLREKKEITQTRITGLTFAQLCV